MNIDVSNPGTLGSLYNKFHPDWEMCLEEAFIKQLCWLLTQRVLPTFSPGSWCMGLEWSLSLSTRGVPWGWGELRVELQIPAEAIRLSHCLAPPGIQLLYAGEGQILRQASLSDQSDSYSCVLGLLASIHCVRVYLMHFSRKKQNGPAICLGK